jgi:hypothetical protein
MSSSRQEQVDPSGRVATEARASEDLRASMISSKEGQVVSSRILSVIYSKSSRNSSEGQAARPEALLEGLLSKRRVKTLL